MSTRPTRPTIYKLIFPILLLILALILLVSRGRDIEPARDLPADDGLAPRSTASTLEPRSYFPSVEGAFYRFKGEGIEYASFTREVVHVEEGYAQVHDNNGGTVVASVYQIKPESITIIYQRPEFYGRENIITEARENPPYHKTIIKGPLKEGTSWQYDGATREIIATDKTVTVPAGTFYKVLQVRTSPAEPDGFTTNSYYAPNVGLIMETFTSGENRITASLASYSIKQSQNQGGN